MVAGTPPSDAAISRIDEDELGREPFVRLIADRVLEAPARDGYVIGLTGAWGSGKTSILNMVEQVLAEQAYIVRFNPWMFSSSDVLVVRFFATLSQVLEAEFRRQEAAKSVQSRRRRLARTAKDAAGPLRSVAEGMAKVGATAAPIASTFLGSALGQFLEAPQKALERLSQPENNPETLRAELRKSLEALDRPIVVFIDDLDRVGSYAEIRELVRLVKLVGDLPGVVYVLSYEPSRVESALGALNSGGGREYLEKVVQAPYALPPVRPRRLHDYCSRQLNAQFEGKLVAFDDEQWAKLAPAVFAYVENIRDVKRLVGACILELGLAGDEVASQDVIALAALRVFDREVHASIGEIARELTGRNSLLDFNDQAKQRKQDRERIDAIVEAGERPDTTRRLLSKLFPAAPLTTFTESADRKSWRAGRRVASLNVLDTYLYASLDESRLSTTQLNNILEALAEPAAARRLLEELTSDQVFDLLDRLGDHPEHLPADDAVGAALEILRLRPRLGQRIGFGLPDTYKIMVAIGALLRTVPLDHREAQVHDLVARAENLSDACTVLREFGTSEESLGERRDDPGSVHLSPAYTAKLEGMLRERIRTDPGRVVNELDFDSFSAWLIESDEPTLEAVREATNEDARLFLQVLEACVLHMISDSLPRDRYELQLDAVDRWLGPLEQVAARAAELEVEDPDERLAAGLQQLATRAAAADDTDAQE